MKIIDLLNKIANGEIEDKRTFNIRFKNGLYRSIYYDKEEENCMCCLKNVSDDYSIYDDISFDTEIETIEEDKKIPALQNLNLTRIDINKKGQIYGVTTKEMVADIQTLQNWINKIIDYINKEK